ncbi:UBAP1-MVB12-associated (UMA)-domain containing protein 1 [Huso huso]|uniref:UBAP1-MVB12-associated (UMA)-domain containing protein 1 n=1 Tax=Huso huso TaxID=61971 RepID=A0ABR1A2W6_HUSHU
MFNFLGIRKDSKKLTPEKEADGFVLLGETIEEQRQTMQRMEHVQQGSNVLIQPSQTTAVNPPAASVEPTQAMNQTAEGAPLISELLSDVPFTLAPHILALQTSFTDIPDALVSGDINDNLASFRYDFTLENSVLCDS